MFLYLNYVSILYSNSTLLLVHYSVLPYSMQPQVQEVAAVDITKWKMRYEDLTLVGSGQYGMVMLGYLKKEATSSAVNEFIAKRITPDYHPTSLPVAVKQFKGMNPIVAQFVNIF